MGVQLLKQGSISHPFLMKPNREGVVCVKKRDGEAFYIKPADLKISPLDIEGVNLGMDII